MELLIRCFLAFHLLLILENTCAQRSFYQFRNEEFGFSFNCPKGWQYQPDTLTTDSGLKVSDRFHGSFIPSDSAELKFYKDCYDGIIFYVEIIPKALDESLLQDGLYSKVNGKYFAHYQFMLSDSLEAEPIQGAGWRGIHHVNTCRIHCKEDDVSAVVEGCEVFYFSNDKITVNLFTTGETLASDVNEMIIKLFRFR